MKNRSKSSEIILKSRKISVSGLKIFNSKGEKIKDFFSYFKHKIIFIYIFFRLNVLSHFIYCRCKMTTNMLQ